MPLGRVVGQPPEGLGQVQDAAGGHFRASRPGLEVALCRCSLGRLLQGLGSSQGMLAGLDAGPQHRLQGRMGNPPLASNLAGRNLPIPQQPQDGHFMQVQDSRHFSRRVEGFRFHLRPPLELLFSYSLNQYSRTRQSLSNA